MKVILLQEIKSLGKAGDVKSVADGYARNFLFPQRVAEPATEAAVKNLARRIAVQAKREGTERARSQELAEKLRNHELRFTLKVGEKGRAFGAVTAQDIADELAKQGIAMEKDWIELEQGIKTTGEHTVKLELPHNIEAAVRVTITPEAEVQMPKSK